MKTFKFSYLDKSDEFHLLRGSIIESESLNSAIRHFESMYPNVRYLIWEDGILIGGIQG